MERLAQMELRLREILKDKGMTLKEFAELSGIRQPNLSNYMNGRISPTLDTLVRIADSLNVPVSELLEEPDDLELFVKYHGELHRLTSKDIITIINSKTI